MAVVSVSVPKEMKQKMDQLELMNWSAIARKAFAEQLAKLELMDKLTANSKATDKDIEELSKKIKAGIARRHNESV